MLSFRFDNLRAVKKKSPQCSIRQCILYLLFFSLNPHDPHNTHIIEALYCLLKRMVMPEAFTYFHISANLIFPFVHFILLRYEREAKKKIIKLKTKKYIIPWFPLSLSMSAFNYSNLLFRKHFLSMRQLFTVVY